MPADDTWRTLDLCLTADRLTTKDPEVVPWKLVYFKRASALFAGALYMAVDCTIFSWPTVSICACASNMRPPCSFYYYNRNRKANSRANSRRALRQLEQSIDVSRLFCVFILLLLVMQAGAVYVFTRLPTANGVGLKCDIDKEGDAEAVWQGYERFKLQAHDAVAADRFGSAVSYLASEYYTFYATQHGPRSVELDGLWTAKHRRSGQGGKPCVCCIFH